MRVLIDACVLYPTLLRGIVLGVARTGAFTPLWSPRILEEWRRAALRTHPEQAAILPGEIALTRAAWPKAEITVPEGAEDALSLPDRDDRHVLAAAIEGGADVIMTLNLKDFPGRTLSRHGVRAEHPDPFLLACYQDAPAALGPVISSEIKVASQRLQPAPTDRSMLKRSRLPRLGKIMETIA